MTLGIMQPYFLPYIGYFQLMSAVDEFVLYDNIEYTKKGWINRNRFLQNGRGVYFTIPIKKGSDYLHIRDRYVGDQWNIERNKILNRITEAYRSAPSFDVVFPLIQTIILFDENNLFKFLLHSLNLMKEYLEIDTKLMVSSSIDINHKLRSKEKIIAICKARRSNTYLNPIGGVELYNKEEFKKEGIELKFVRSDSVVYDQFENDFVSFLSIIDLMMFKTIEELKIVLNLYKLE